MKEVKKIKEFNSESWEDIKELDKLLEEIKTFDLYIIYLMFKNEMMKRGYDV